MMLNQKALPSFKILALVNSLANSQVNVLSASQCLSWTKELHHFERSTDVALRSYGIVRLAMDC